MEFRITDKVSKKDASEIRDRLIEYNLSKIEDKNPKDIGIFYEAPNGEKLAGLIGDTHGNWLEVDFLWVSEELRRNGIGSAILSNAESEARLRGCKYAFLNTFGFQAPEFYKRHGYKEVFSQSEYPVTGSRHFFIKEL